MFMLVHFLLLFTKNPAIFKQLVTLLLLCFFIEIVYVAKSNSIKIEILKI